MTNSSHFCAHQLVCDKWELLHRSCRKIPRIGTSEIWLVHLVFLQASDENCRAMMKILEIHEIWGKTLGFAIVVHVLHLGSLWKLLDWKHLPYTNLYKWQSRFQIFFLIPSFLGTFECLLIGDSLWKAYLLLTASKIKTARRHWDDLKTWMTGDRSVPFGLVMMCSWQAHLFLFARRRRPGWRRRTRTWSHRHQWWQLVDVGC
jgi:hypothetical protein